MSFQVVEKDDFGTDWAPVRYNEKVLQRFETQEEAIKAASEYVTDRNCNNALAKEEKLNAIEVFMLTDEGCYLGDLDKEAWFLTYPKDIVDKQGNIKYAKGDNVKDVKFFMLEGKTQVAVRPLPGT